MHQKKILTFVRNATILKRIVDVVSDFDADISAANVAPEELLSAAAEHDIDLVITDCYYDELEKTFNTDLADEKTASISLLVVIVDKTQMTSLRLPVQLSSDFMCNDASEEEYAARIKRLLWPGEESSGNDFIRQGSLTLNLATYQVRIDGNPVDFTYLEYALLAFLITHPGRTYSRDALLNRVWDFDYYGGSRTVDVHVRRIRAKLGPDLAQYLKTIRGVGYLWSF